jgi:hypothetical protein
VTLSDNIFRLTSQHLIITDGQATKVRSLLGQLDAAMTDKTGRTGGGGSRALLISDAAYSLRQDIDWAARNEQYQRTGTDIGSLGAIIQSWNNEQDAEMIAYLEHVTLDWCDQIKAIVNPSKPPWRPAVPCPACGIIYDREGNGPGMRVHCWGEDEAMLPPGDWTAECIHCKAAWTSEKMSWLARVLEVAS